MVTRSCISFNNGNNQKLFKKSPRRYVSPQPVLSCRSLDVDVGGTRTYRPKSSVDIIHEQHKLIHDVYSANRAQSALPRRESRAQSAATQGERRERMYHQLQVTQKAIRPRPQTSTTPISPPSGPIPRTLSCRLRRPHTTGQLTKINSSLQGLQPYILLKDTDLDEGEAIKQKGEITQQIHSQWTPRNHDLNIGQFIKGQGQNTGSLYPSNYNTWVTFAGAASEDNRLVDAFTLFEDEEHFYNIDSSVGCRVAQQLLTGDKIRIGINGKMQARNLKIKKTSVDSYEYDESVLIPRPEDQVIPLSWESQLESPDVVIREIKSKQPESAPMGNRDTTPVVYEKFFTTPQPRPLLASVRSSDKRKNPNTALHKAAHKLSSNSRVIDISSSGDDTSQTMTLEEILQHHVRKPAANDKGDNLDTDPNTGSSDVNSDSDTKRDNIKKSKTSILMEKSNVYNKNFSRPISSICRRMSDNIDLSIDMTNGENVNNVNNVNNDQKRLDYRQGLIRSSRPKGGKHVANDKNPEFIRISTQLAPAKETVIIKPTRSQQHPTPPSSARLTTSSLDGNLEILEFLEIDTFLENCATSPLRTNSPVSCENLPINDNLPLSPPISIPTATEDSSRDYPNEGNEITATNKTLSTTKSHVKNPHSNSPRPPNHTPKHTMKSKGDKSGRSDILSPTGSSKSVGTQRTLLKKHSVHFDLESVKNGH